MTPTERQQLENEANLRIPNTKAASATALIRLVELADGYIDKVVAAMPTIETDTKAYDWGTSHVCGDRCNHHVEKAFTTRQISDIEKRFRQVMGSPVVNALLDDESLWMALAAGASASEIAGTPLFVGRNTVADKAFKWAYIDAKKIWDANFDKFGMPWAQANPMIPKPLSVTADIPWLNRLNREGYSLVRDKIKLEYLPRIKQIISDNAIDGVPWNQIASNLRKEIQFGKRWDWVRLVRTELANAGQKASIEQYTEMGVPFVRWSASRGSGVCDVCQGLNGEVFIVAETPPLPHPQCRCVMIPVWGKKKVAAPRTSPIPIAPALN